MYSRKQNTTNEDEDKQLRKGWILNTADKENLRVPCVYVIKCNLITMID